MVVNQKNTGRAKSIPSGLAFGALISLLVTLLSTLVLAKLLETEVIIWERIGYGIMVLIFAASFFGALSAYRKIRRQRLIVCMLSGFLYFGILLSMTALFFGGQYESMGITATLVLAGCGLAALLGIHRNGRQKIGKRPHINR